MNSVSRNITACINTMVMLRMAVNRMLKLYDGLVSMFKSESENTPRFWRLQKAFSGPLTEVYLLFFNSAFPCFTTFNKFLQRSDPCVQWVYDYMGDLLKVILGTFLRPSIIRDSPQLQLMDFLNKDSQQPDGSLSIGFITKSKIRKLENEGEVSVTQRKKFYSGVKIFYQGAADYITRKFPFSSQVLQHSRFVDIEKRDNVELENVYYFVEKYNDVLKFTEDEMMDEEFNYSTLIAFLPEYAWEEARVRENPHNGEKESSTSFRMDVMWTYLTSVKSPDGCFHKFKRLSKVAFLVMTIPHSNASEEQVFNLIRANKTYFRHSLDLEGTLSSIIMIKMAELNPCYRPSKEMLEAAKKATWSYNK